MKRSSLLQLMVILLVLPLCSGCWLMRILGFPVGDEVPYNPKAEAGDVSVKRNIQFVDIPVPMGFEVRRDVSYSFQGSAFRFGYFRYEGVWGMPQTVNFYRRQMPLTQWLPEVDEADGRWKHRFLYAKGTERCRVLIESTVDGIVVDVRLFNAARDNTASLRAGASAYSR